METKTRLPVFKIQKDYQVIGSGPMIEIACQVGDWWVTPAQAYQGKIPADIQRELFEFLNQGVEIQGILIAEDIREIEAKKEQEEKKKEANKKAVATGLGTVLTPLIAIGLGVIYLIAAIVAYDPMLIAVLKDGRWVCLGTWYD